MKNLILTLFCVLIFNLAIAQEDEAYLIQFHYMEVTGDTEDFIKTNKEFYKKLAQKGVAEEKWAGWGMMQSWSEPNKFLFFHHFKSPKQYAAFDFSIFNNDLAQELGLETPNWETFEAKGIAPFEIWQIVDNVLSEQQSSYFIMNEFKFTDRQKFVDLNRLWGELVMKPQQKENIGANWAFGMKLTNNHWEDGQMVNYNGISFDGFPSIEALLKSATYIDNSPNQNKYLETYMKEIEERQLSSASDARKQSIWKFIDDSWN